MDSLHLLLVQNQNNLDKLRARTRYCSTIIASAQFDTHKQYGPYSDYWEDWLDHAGIILSDLRSDVAATAQFVSELRDFVILIQDTDDKSRVRKKRTEEMRSFAMEAIACQLDMIHMADQRINEHREFTHKLLMVEALDGLSED
jgi:hypothetical protein